MLVSCSIIAEVFPTEEVPRDFSECCPPAEARGPGPRDSRYSSSDCARPGGIHRCPESAQPKHLRQSRPPQIPLYQQYPLLCSSREGAGKIGRHHTLALLGNCARDQHFLECAFPPKMLQADPRKRKFSAAGLSLSVKQTNCFVQKSLPAEIGTGRTHRQLLLTQGRLGWQGSFTATAVGDYCRTADDVSCAALRAAPLSSRLCRHIPL